MSENPHNVSPRYEDEISLYDLYRILAEKAILISTIINALLAAIVYLYIVPPIYEAKLRLLLPKPSTLVLSKPSHTYTEFDANTVFHGSKAHLGLMEEWHQFVAASPELFSPEIRASQSNSLLDHPITFSKNKNYPAEHMDVAFQHEGSSAASLIMSGYLEFLRKQAKFEAVISGQVAFVQANHSRSVKNVLRGLHDQIQQPQDKSLAEAEHFA